MYHYTLNGFMDFHQSPLERQMCPYSFLLLFVFSACDKSSYVLLGIVQAAYNIGGRVISANAIEQSIFCFRTPRIGWVLTFLLLKNRNSHIWIT